ncbi:cadmium resistance transporter [Prescottella agglutinans]|uniref:Cadmium resistance protein CadD (Predicted permease) n=1 Tax=Prescottella agglutinans TaxID=1644129 RepID=A0ABT6MA22_9NOCA|nr:cadmium resistance transporter [Prescottella agglutinans]MDH6281156.1 cadmium resistance protein CadD (predicted permease) [Prescottella agglutinans]
MNPGVIGQAIGAFAATNIDDLVVLLVFFGQAAGHRGAAMRVVAGQYLGFIAILAVSIATALAGSALLPPEVLPYFGLVPLALGLRAGWIAWRTRRSEPDDPDLSAGIESRTGPGILEVAAVTFSNGGDNIGVYVPIFAVASVSTISLFALVFLICVALWCLGGRYFASHPVVARVLARWGHVILPVALIAIGLTILIEGGAFGI